MPESARDADEGILVEILAFCVHFARSIVIDRDNKMKTVPRKHQLYPVRCVSVSSFCGVGLVVLLRCEIAQSISSSRNHGLIYFFEID